VTVPRFEALLAPVLQAASDGMPHKVHEVAPILAARLRLTDTDRRQVVASGRRNMFENRVYWAKMFLVQAGLIEGVERGSFRITAEGSQALAERGDAIDRVYLRSLPKFQAWRARVETKRPDSGGIPSPEDAATTPQEQLDNIVSTLTQQVKDDLLKRLKEVSPSYFERLVLTLLIKMGYGGSLPDAAQAVGGAGDGGIDGLINEDRLGLDVVYVQAKRWDGVVGRPTVQAFAGSLDGRRARRGVLITTSSFSRDADQYARSIEKRIVLMDGEMLTTLMVEYNVGVVVDQSVHIKKVDLDFFEED